MKKLVLVRHGKAEPWAYTEKDRPRKLISRGIKNAEFMSEMIKEQGISADIIISSDAERSIKTAEIFADTLGTSKDNLKQLHWLYEDVVTDDFVQLLQSIDDSKETIFIFGHNPWISTVAHNLTSNFSQVLPTCAFAVIEFPAKSWKEVEARSGTAVQFEYPKKYK